jgi:hypothetical protein
MMKCVMMCEGDEDVLDVSTFCNFAGLGMEQEREKESQISLVDDV